MTSLEIKMQEAYSNSASLPRAVLYSRLQLDREPKKVTRPENCSWTFIPEINDYWQKPSEQWGNPYRGAARLFAVIIQGWHSARASRTLICITIRWEPPTNHIKFYFNKLRSKTDVIAILACISELVERDSWYYDPLDTAKTVKWRVRVQGVCRYLFSAVSVDRLWKKNMS